MQLMKDSNGTMKRTEAHLQQRISEHIARLLQQNGQLLTAR
jgi:hypothetical protein